MKVYRFEDKIEVENNIYVLGGFESFHLGHYDLFKKALTLSKNAILMLFKDTSILPKSNQKNIFDLNTRLQIAADIGFEYVKIIDFEAVSSLSGKQFLEIISSNQNARFIFGDDFRFGYKASNNTNDILVWYPNSICVELKKIRGTKISSTLIKNQIMLGYIEFANSLMVTDWTINILLDASLSFAWPNLIKPPEGVYAAIIEIDEFSFFCALKVQERSYIEFIDFKVNKFNVINRNLSLSINKEIRFTNKEINTEDIKMIKKYFNKGEKND
ncbi:FAD synthase [Mycoplasma phocimorsus]|uniref:FAD synthase n=1 Tax=Mycoplasma phocimorsus TaxID=3045839 RepID=UPI0024BF7641|nr:hypothetical protein [Mycoplasma phocimorsus]MDJ1646273.1 hypothetical protein [Mycoplasma phocimorsus]MDJ1647844.1 hypothetical protein [Mycoplasma phocimorsus]MDJ1648455.1 hypothetical protein [Mycoplasma phocimorsus]MDJ1648594.1 hypothetical protein [Mycoplasma phocimorsus]